jgi:hypothetical protein
MKENKEILFEEKQRFTQWWFWLIILGCTALIWYMIIWGVILQNEIGGEEVSGGIISGFLLGVIGIAVPYLFYKLELKVEVTPKELSVKYKPFSNRKIQITDIDKIEARQYKPFKEYGGWGIKGWKRSKIAYNVSGNQGVELTMKNGNTVMIGSHKSEELEKVLKSLVK